MSKHTCKCGAVFSKRSWLMEHIGICNPHWPRHDPKDEHGEVTIHVEPIRILSKEEVAELLKA